MKRFKWAYFDFIMWLSYIPFLYYALYQTKNFNFNSISNGVSNIISITIFTTYPLYPLFIGYLIKTNY